MWEERPGKRNPSRERGWMNWQSHWQGVTEEVALEGIQLWGNEGEILTGAPKQREQWGLYSGWAQR